MPDLPPWALPLLRDRTARTALAVLGALLFYTLVVAGEVGRTGTVSVTALPAALALVWWRTRPALAMALSAAGILLLGFLMLNGFSVQSVLQQAPVVLAVLGGALAADLRLRRAAGGLAGLAAVGVLLFAASRSESSTATGVTLAVPLLALCVAPLVVAELLRRTRHGRDLLTRELDLSLVRERDAEREIVVVQERNRVAREVHDIVAHSLAVVVAQADGARYAARQDPATVEPALEAIADTARTALTEVRTLLQELRHSQGSRPAPVLADLDSLLDAMRDLGLTIEVTSFGHQRGLAESTQLAAYRIIQESLTNALRYGDRSAPVQVEYDWGDRSLSIVVTSALREDEVPHLGGQGHGVPGMRERAALAGGELSVAVGTRGTFRVRATLPVKPAPSLPAASAPARATA